MAFVGPAAQAALSTLPDRYVGPSAQNALNVLPDRFVGPVVMTILQVVTVQRIMLAAGDGADSRKFNETLDEALLSRIEGTLTSRQLWADVAATLIQIGNGGGNAVLQVLAGATQDLVLGARGQQLPFNDGSNLNLSGFAGAASLIAALNENRADITTNEGDIATLQSQVGSIDSFCAYLGGELTTVTQNLAIVNGDTSVLGANTSGAATDYVVVRDAEILAIALNFQSGAGTVEIQRNGTTQMTLSNSGVFASGDVGFVDNVAFTAGQNLRVNYTAGAASQGMTATVYFRSV